ncbi:ABC transporter substrate-binding protein [Pseudobutyrivibrio xylanivorans]|uniref:Peptide/nickel transport system substrate-binding protein n=1 Tax=Pseudobutyrivibrio xylanivorans TaxID=185007 RepID=A0A1G5RWD4_PSEXY|nr:ABC transporter substrate-binding protein [Pseudobutyrivibrio xylanivorans]SCZ78356.1 peptide/nickel transport system substrate-binding protein [Pseudobutyrivibrio xylanivorans]
MKKKKIVSLLLVATMALSMVACGKKADDAGKSESGASNGSDTPLVIGWDAMSQKFSPFFAESHPDMYLDDKCVQLELLKPDRAGQYILNGIDGYTAEYNGTEYTYYTPANIDVTENEDGSVTYSIKLREDMKFSDGEPVTIDDVIFSYYVVSDPTYDGPSTFASLPVKGMEEYRSGVSTLSVLIAEAGKDNTDFTNFTEEQQKAFWDACANEGAAFAQSIVDYMVANAGVAEGDVKAAAAGWGFDLADGATTEDFFMAIGEQYGWNFSSMDKEAADVTIADSFPEDVLAMSTTGVETGESADHIEGIVKTGDYSCDVIVTEFSAPAIEKLATDIAPMHYYGDASLYDYDNNKFGFPKNDLSIVREKTTAPMGAGPYKFVEYKNKIAYLEANENYYLGAPSIKSIQFKETAGPDKVPGVVQGTIDLTEPSMSKATAEQIAAENSNGEIAGDVLTATLADNLGYGYIGMCAKNVKVGNDPASEASKNLRKAIATVIAAYRDVVIDSYYGDSADVIQYPISNSSWAAPQKSDPDYEIAFSKDVNGDPIYTEGMSDDEKYDAALKAALGFFEAAGYTVTDGKLTAAPSGAKLSYEAMIPADGTGDHPAFGILTGAKESFDKIGFELVINDLSDSSVLWDTLSAQKAEIWCAAWGATPDPDMYQVYHSQGGSAYQYAVYSDELDALIMDARTSADQSYRKAVYKECLDFIVDFAVEIPTYQRQNAVLYSSERVNLDSLVKDPTPFWIYLDEIANLQMQ